VISLALAVTLLLPSDTARCTWEGRLPERIESQPAVSRPNQVARLTRTFRNGSKNDRLLAVRWLGAIGDRAGMPVLIEAVSDTSKHIALEAVWALGRIPDNRVPSLLMTALKRPDEQIQQAAACGLGRTAGAEVLPELRRLLRSSNVFVVSAARWSIARIQRTS
jgi:HEAT repeat protein